MVRGDNPSGCRYVLRRYGPEIPWETEKEGGRLTPCPHWTNYILPSRKPDSAAKNNVVTIISDGLTYPLNHA